VIVIAPLFGSVVFFIVYLAWRSRYIRGLVALDDLDQSQEEIALPQSRALALAMIAFNLGHTFVVTWDYFKRLIARWPESLTIWLLWACFCSAFPEETEQLIRIDHIIGKLKTHRSDVAHLRSQIVNLARRREDAMTHVLKKKIRAAQLLIQTARNHIRHFWECVIQSNVADMEMVAQSAKTSVQAAETEIMHLLRRYPNNQHVARLYARFTLSVKGDRLACKHWRQNSEHLKAGHMIEPDGAQQEAMMLFPNIVSLALEKNGSAPGVAFFGENTTCMSLTVTNFAMDNQSEEEALRMNIVRDSIRSLRIPAIVRARIVFGVGAVLMLAVLVQRPWLSWSCRQKLSW